MSTNWLKLQRKLTTDSKKKYTPKYDKRTKRGDSRRTILASPAPSQSNHGEEEQDNEPGTSSSADGSVKSLRKMVEGHAQFSEKQCLPGKYLAIDCEMVGVGPEGEESSLARVSVVNFYGAVILDEFVKQRERVVDYRTQFSGIRPADMVKAKPFTEIQKQVAELAKDRILVGHAIHNDLKALLLSHPYPLTRDTQVLAFKSKITKSKRIALRNLVKQELDMTIQSGEHSSVTDARATMAIYRIHKKSWDKLLGAFSRSNPPPIRDAAGKRKASALESDDDGDGGNDEDLKPKGKKAKSSSMKGQLPGPAGRKGVSSGLSTIVRHGAAKTSHGARGGGDQEKAQWWAKLPTTKTSGSKGSMKL